MNCTQIQAMLDGDDPTTAPDLPVVRAHLASCASCRKRHFEISWLVDQGLAAWPAGSHPAHYGWAGTASWPRAVAAVLLVGVLTVGGAWLLGAGASRPAVPPRQMVDVDAQAQAGSAPESAIFLAAWLGEAEVAVQVGGAVPPEASESAPGPRHRHVEERSLVSLASRRPIHHRVRVASEAPVDP